MSGIDPRIGRFQAALQIPTISSLDGEARTNTFGQLRALMQASYPHLFALATVENPQNQTLMLTIPGSDASLAPNVVIAHQDVVPVTGQTWKFDPFSATIADDQIFARGCIDDKANLMATLEAVEALLASGKKPARTLVLTLSDDEELLGKGATACAAMVKDRYGRVESVFDEGSFVLPAGFVTGVNKPAAMIATGEKGYLTIELTAKGKPGHASTPDPDGAIEQLTRALAAIQAHPFPPTLTGPTRDFLHAIAPFQGWLKPLFNAAAAGWKAAEAIVLRGIPGLSPGLLARPNAAAMVRVTTAPVTLAAASGGDNVIPAEAKSVINMRLLPGVTIAGAIAYVQGLAGPAISVAIRGPAKEAPAPSSTSHQGYKLMASALAAAYPDAAVIPFLTTATTDSAAFASIAGGIFRCVGAKVTPAQFAAVHGANEAIGIQAYLDLVRFQTTLIGEANGFH
jgi:carboxypeptidase PM20D1